MDFPPFMAEIYRGGETNQLSLAFRIASHCERPMRGDRPTQRLHMLVVEAVVSSLEHVDAKLCSMRRDIRGPFRSTQRGFSLSLSLSRCCSNAVFSLVYCIRTKGFQTLKSPYTYKGRMTGMNCSESEFECVTLTGIN